MQHVAAGEMHAHCVVCVRVCPCVSVCVLACVCVPVCVIVIVGPVLQALRFLDAIAGNLDSRAEHSHLER